mgnify:CR=1 FL=1
MENITLSLLNIFLYIDPGTGSIILQAIIASVVGAAFFIRLFWHRILRVFGVKKETEPDLADEQEEDEK